VKQASGVRKRAFLSLESLGGLLTIIFVAWSALMVHLSASDRYLYLPPSDQSITRPLLYWKLDEGNGAIAHDASGHGQVGKIGASWNKTPAGTELELDGTSSTVISTEFTPSKRLGTGSWTVSAWIRPKQFAIQSNMNQRRLFGYGAFPQGFANVDILSSGVPTLYQCYQRPGADVVGFSAESSMPISVDHWAFLVVECDRKAGWVRFFINGRPRGGQKLPSDFHPDLGVSGEFTVGSGWQNYWGAVAEVRLYNCVVGTEEIREEFQHLRGRFGVVPTREELKADAELALQAKLDNADRAVRIKVYASARKDLAIVVNDWDAPAELRAYGQLRLAKTWVASGNLKLARQEYNRIAANPNFNDVHRQEARDLVGELDRTVRGLPPRDSAASHVNLAPLPTVRARVFVAPGGDNGASGSINHPVADLETARDRVRELRKTLRAGTIEVDLAPGIYPRRDTFELSSQDGGTAASPVVYRAEKPGAALLYGGVELHGFEPVTDPAVLSRLPAASRGRVVQWDLKAQGITDYGTLAVRGFGQSPSPPTLELYVNGQPQTLARWPNHGFVQPTKLVDPGNSSSGAPSVLAYDGDEPARWTQAEEPWLFGYFKYLWADGTVEVGKIDTVAKTITTVAPYHYGSTGMAMEQGIKFYAFNLLEEIDMPGEWYLNRKTGILYLYPPCEPSKAKVEISILKKPMVHGTRLSYVRFEGVTFDLGRSDGIDLDESSDCQIVGCTVRRVAANGVTVHGGVRDTLLSCDVYNIGRRATEIIGGKRITLMPGGHIVVNCSIHDFGRIDRTYTPGVQLEGVGNRVVHNLFYNCPSSAMRIEGNDHVMEYNEVHHVLQESDDQGAMELFGNPTYRGVVFRFNYYHDLGSGAQDRLVAGQAGIRLDDAISGMLIYGNVFDRAANGAFGGVQINSGRDNVIDNNVFADSSRGISGGYYAGNPIWQQVASPSKPADYITSELYMQRYPAMTWMLKQPAVNHVWRNVFYRVGTELSGNPGGYDWIGNKAIGNVNPGFMNPDKGRFGLLPSSSLPVEIGFRPIPFSEIGLYHDSWRR